MTGMPLRSVIAAFFAVVFVCAALCLSAGDKTAASTAILTPVITATNNDALVTDVDGDGHADPGDTVEYTVTVTNAAGVGAGNDALGMTLTDTLDANMTLVAGSVQSSPIAGNDSFTSLGNVSISVPDGANDLLANDFDPDTGNNSGLTASGGTLSANGGNVAISANGSFTYNPPVGFEGADTFAYTVTDGNGNTGSGTVTINVSGMIWFVNNNSPACTTLAGGCGRLSNPMSTMAAFQVLNNGVGNNPSVNDNVFVFESATAYTAATLLTGQKLIGQDATVTLATITGLAIPPFSVALPAMNTGGNATTFAGGAGTGVALNSNNTLRGFSVGNSTPGINGTNFGTLSVNDLIINSNSTALILNNGTANGSFTSVTSTGGNVNVNLTNVAGSLNLGGGALSGAASYNLLVNQGTGAITYGGTVTAGNATRPVEITNKTGGSVTLNGLVSTQSATTSNGPFLNANSGTYTFAGGVQVSTGSNAAFTATSSGTLVVTQNNTSIVNTLATTSGTALNISNTTIGASGITFRSISSNGAASGIVLNATGSSGGLTVTGNGGTCTAATPTCTGGTISNSTDAGVKLTSTSNVSLTRMRINTSTNFGLSGTTVTGMTIDSSVFDGTHGNAIDEGALFVTNWLGTGTLSNSEILGGFNDNMRVNNTTGTLNRLTISGTTIRNSGNNHGLAFYTCLGGLSTDCSGVTMNMTVTNSSFSNNSSNHIDTGVKGLAAMDLVISSNTFATPGAGGNPALGGAVNMSIDHQSDLTFDVNGNTSTGSKLTAFNFFVSNQTLANSSMVGRFRNNVVGTSGVPLSGSREGGALTFTATGAATVTAAITGNILRNWATNNGVDLNAGDGGATGPQVNLTVTGNTLNLGSANVNHLHGISSQMGTTSGGGAVNACLDIGGTGLSNNFSGSSFPAGGGFEMRVRQRFSSTVRLPGYAGGNTDTTAVANYLFGRNIVTAPASSNISTTVQSPPGGGFTGGGACSQPAFTEIADEPAASASVAQPAEEMSPSGSEIAEQAEPINAVVSAEPVTDVPLAGNRARSFGFFAAALGHIGNGFAALSNAIVPTAYSQGKDDGTAQLSGETVSVGAFSLPASKSVTIKFRATVNAQPPIFTQVSNQGTVSGANFPNVLTDDPSVAGSANPTLTAIDSTTVSVTSSQNPSVSGQSVTFTANLTSPLAHATSPSGTVQFFENGNPIGAPVAVVAGGANIGSAQFATSSLTSGNHTITAEYSGGGQFNANSGSLTGNPQVVSNTAVWDGSASTDWNNAANWATNFAPVAANDVSIPASGVTNNPSISASNVSIGSITVASPRVLTITTGRSLSVSGACVNNANFTVAGTFSCGSYSGSGSVTFNGTVAQFLPALAYQNLTINNPSGVSLGGDTTINGVLTLTSGLVNAGANNLILGGTATVTRTAGHVLGNVRKTFNGAGSFSFPVGTGNGFSPATVNVTAGTFPLAFDVRAVQGTHPNLPGATSLGRYWQIAPTGGSPTANLTLNYLQSDVSGNESVYAVVKYVGINPTPFPHNPPAVVIDTVNNTATVNGVASFSDWTMTEFSPTAAAVDVSGRLMTDDGRAVNGGLIELVDSNGRVSVTRSNPFGYFRFEGLESGATYTLNVRSRNYVFAPRLLTVTEDIGELTIIAEP